MNLIDKTDDKSYKGGEIIFCPYCWEVNYIPCVYTAGGTTGIINCTKCGLPLN